MSAGRSRATKADVVEVTIPARPEFVSVVRLTAAAVAARRGFSYDEIEDLKIAVTEACTALITSGSDPAHPMGVRFLLEPAALEVRIETRSPGVTLHDAASPGGTPLDGNRLGVFLMQCLVDEIEARSNKESGTAELRLVKRRQG